MIEKDKEKETKEDRDMKEGTNEKLISLIMINTMEFNDIYCNSS
jgi:hypothetical protein